MDPRGSTVEALLAALATPAQGVVDRQQLLRAGVSAGQIKARIRKGALIPEFAGVYRVGHAAPSTDAHYLAAVRACGDEALLFGMAAAYVHVLVKGTAPPPEVTAPTCHRVEGVITRRCRVEPCDATTVRGIPVTTVPRTLVAIAAVLPPDELARACHEAGVRYRVTPRHVQAVLARHPNAAGARNLRLVIEGETKVTLSKLERAFLRFLREHGFPLPEMNRVAGGRRVDCRWPRYRLTVELDGYRFHNSRHSWEQGLQREREARARKEEFRRFSYADVFEDQRYMLSELNRLLPRRDGSGVICNPN